MSDQLDSTLQPALHTREITRVLKKSKHLFKFYDVKRYQLAVTSTSIPIYNHQLDTLEGKAIMEEPHFDIFIDDTDIIAGATEIVRRIRPLWQADGISHKIFTNGISNKLVGIYHQDNHAQMVLVRVYGHKTDLLIDRNQELQIIRSLHKVGFTHSIYATFNNGMAYEFIEGDTLTVKSIRQPEVYELVAKRMAKMHLLKPLSLNVDYNKAVLWEKTEKWLDVLTSMSFSDPNKQNKFENLIRPTSVLIHEYQVLKENLLTLDTPTVFCHNDLLLTNILHNTRENKVTFIDFEYAAYNCQSFDIANHFAEFAGVDNPDYSLLPTKELQKHWLQIYLKTYRNTCEVSKEDVERLYKQVNQFVLMSHFFWGCWALIQSHYSRIDFDFLGYAQLRFDEYFKRKEVNSSRGTGLLSSDI